MTANVHSGKTTSRSGRRTCPASPRRAAAAATAANRPAVPAAPLPRSGRANRYRTPCRSPPTKKMPIARGDRGRDVDPQPVRVQRGDQRLGRGVQDGDREAEGEQDRGQQEEPERAAHGSGEHDQVHDDGDRAEGDDELVHVAPGRRCTASPRATTPTVHDGRARSARRAARIPRPARRPAAASGSAPATATSAGTGAGATAASAVSAAGRAAFSGATGPRPAAIRARAATGLPASRARCSRLRLTARGRRPPLEARSRRRSRRPAA